jgi:hypothetical protein
MDIRGGMADYYPTCLDIMSYRFIGVDAKAQGFLMRCPMHTTRSTEERRKVIGREVDPA